MKTSRSQRAPRPPLGSTGKTLLACLALVLALPCCQATTTTFLETFDRWPSRELSFPLGGAKWTNLLGNGALRLGATFPAASGWRWVTYGGAHGWADLLRGGVQEQRLDLLKFTAARGSYLVMGCVGNQAEELTTYLLALGEQKVLFLKYAAYPKVFARLLHETVAFPLEQITPVLRFQWAGDNLEARIQVLDLANGNAVLFDRTVLDTPGVDPVAEAPWEAGGTFLNEDSGEPYGGSAAGWFAIVHTDPASSSIEALIDNCQWTTIGMGVDEFLGEVYTNAVGRTLPFRLFVPPGYDPANRYPLVLFLHGMGECGTDNRSQIAWCAWAQSFASPENQAKQPCFLLAPQSPGDWMDVVDRVLDLLGHLQTRYAIDPDRLYVTGLSMGGWGTFDYLAHRPNLFAAGVPMCCALGSRSQALSVTAGRIAPIPLWAFCGALDTDYNRISDVRAMVDAVRGAGGHPIYTEYARGAHPIWPDAYYTPGLYDWLMRQRRGAPLTGPPTVTIQLPTAEPLWTTLSPTVNVSGVVSPEFNASRVMVTCRGTSRAEGAQNWSKTDLILSPGLKNRITVKAYASTPPLILAGETVVADILTVAQRQLVLELAPLGDQVRLRWTAGADRYSLESCADPAVPNWTPITSTSATELTLPRVEQPQFYRVKLGP